MVIEYKEDEIVKTEQFTQKPLIGYINPHGKIINYSTLIGEIGHDNWRNPATPIFLKLISFVIKGESTKWLEDFEFYDLLEKNKYDGFDEVVKRGLEYAQKINYDSYDDFLRELDNMLNVETEFAKSAAKYYKSYWNRDEFATLRYDLVKLFHKLYSNKDFFNSLGRVVYVESESYISKKYHIYDGVKQSKFYHDYLVVQLMSYFKDFLVQYLGYDSIERAMPDSDLILFNNIHDGSHGYTFSDNPRIIETSCTNINERFYNWLLMDWEIQRVPRYYWNEKEKKFELEQINHSFFQTDKEEILGKEIEAIRNQIPRDKRKAYFR